MIKKNFTIFLYIALSSVVSIHAQVQTVGLFKNDVGAFEGYTLFAPIGYKTVYLIDMQGRLVNSWESEYTPALSVYLTPQGNLLRTCNKKNANFQSGVPERRVRIISWDGVMVWDYFYSSTDVCQHHDVEMLPNGNVLIIAWEKKTQAQAVDAGRDPSMLDDGELWVSMHHLKVCT